MQAMAGQLPPLQGQYSDFVDECSRTAMPTVSRRPSRSSSNHRSSNSMRVVKPTSASNSPQAPWGNRRRTMMHDSASSQRTQQVLEQVLATQDFGLSQQTSRRSSRPVSWHPGSYVQQQALSTKYMPQPDQQTLSTQSYFVQRQQTSPHYPHMSPGMIACSANTSPASAFSPLPLQSSGLATHNSHYIPSEAWQMVQRSTPFYPTPNEPREYVEPFPAYGNGCPISAEGVDWQNYMMHGMSTTTPPTPDSLMQPESALPPMPQESPAFQTLDEPEEEGEVLVGMGLYDAPEKMNEDPQLDNYRSTVSTLLGSRFRPSEPQGKGLKLEETWSPPPKSDEDDDDGGDDGDDDGEEADVATKSSTVET